MFHREGKRLVLSRLGQAVKPHLDQLLGESEAALQAALNFRLLKATPLALGVMPTVGPTRLGRFLEHYRRANSHAELAVSSASLADLLKQLTGKDEGPRPRALGAESPPSLRCNRGGPSPPAGE